MEYNLNFKYLPLFLLPMLISCDSNENIDVIISNGKLQCQDNAISINTTKAYLSEAGIEVESESCGQLTGLSYATVCGGGTGQIHIFSINQSALNEAENIGFTDSAKLESGVSYEKVSCSSL